MISSRLALAVAAAFGAVFFFHVFIGLCWVAIPAGILAAAFGLEWIGVPILGRFSRRRGGQGSSSREEDPEP